MLMTLLAFLITISVVVVFHEFGHYLACRLFAIEVERFSVGFGKLLYKRKDKRGTEWAISLLPLGGYVKPLSAESPNYHADNAHASIESKSALQRFIVYAAGPIFSLLLAIIIYSLTFMWGQPQVLAQIAAPAAQSAAAQAGLHKDDLIVAVNQNTIRNWEELNTELAEALSLGSRAQLGYVKATNAEKLLQGHFDFDAIEPSLIKETEIQFSRHEGSLENVNLMGQAGLTIEPKTIVVKNVLDISVAHKAGIQKGDVLEGLCGHKLSPKESLEAIRNSPDQALCLQVVRPVGDQQQRLQFKVTPAGTALEDGRYIGRIGVEMGPVFNTQIQRDNPLRAILRGSDKTFKMSWFSIKMLGKVISGDLSWRNLSGPIAIADYSGKVAAVGVLPFINFIALISLSIGVLNLIPIPGLDGGQMLLSVIEMARGKTLSKEMMTKLIAAGYSVLLLVFVLVITNDLSRIF
ncbi:RIP metalloprotease RseP [Brackiella oedipodis]|uniref:RIP metalloprotease RseP n=1 Tax=Brackiella oedipodis TaxID=124225 RepID=UPI00048D4F30|nr:RIP metalloprotease RseP [Brackiella oedipodis]